MYVMVDAANQNRSVANVVFTPDARTNLAEADQITMQTIFDSVPGTLVSPITGGSGKYKNARGQVVTQDGPDGLIDVVIHLTMPRSPGTHPGARLRSGGGAGARRPPTLGELMGQPAPQAGGSCAARSATSGVAGT